METVFNWTRYTTATVAIFCFANAVHRCKSIDQLAIAIGFGSGNVI